MPATILIIDDNPSDIYTLVEILRDQNFRVMVALDGMDGFNKAVSGQPALILLDRLMPEIDGLKTCCLLKSNLCTASIPIIFLTAMQAIEDKVEGFKLGACDYITKPWQAAEVIARLRVHVELHRRLREISIVPITVNKPVDEKEMTRAELRVYKAQLLYLQSINASLTLAEVAQSVGTHARQLATDFRQVTGQSVQAWLREKRLRSACDLLLNSEQEIARIAEQVGYTSASAFSNAFRDYFGLSASEYRRLAGLKICKGVQD